MAARTIIIGGGITGAAIAYALAQKGLRDVTLIEAGTLAGQSSGRSFGWINASFSIDAHHFAFRHRAMAAWRRYGRDTSSVNISWPGGLIWEHTGPEMLAQAKMLGDMNYRVEIIDKKEFSKHENNVARPPDTCLFFPEEGVVETDLMTREMLERADTKVISGARVLQIETRAGRVSGVRLEQGEIAADQVIIAAGTGSPGLLAPFGVALPMLRRPGLLMRTRPLAPLIHHVLASPTQELRQDARGRLVAPTTPAHQSDTATTLAEHPDVLARDTIRRLRQMLPGVTLDWQEVMLAWRPVPGDGLPVIGPCGPKGLYLAVMHSGATLAMLVGELVARELIAGESDDMLTPYRPERFNASTR